MSHVPTECEVALLRQTASTVAQCPCDNCQEYAVRLRATADADATRCKVVLTQLVQRELSILCTDAFWVSQRLSDELAFAHPDAGVFNGERAVAAGCDARAEIEDIYKRLRTLLDRAITPSAKAQEWLALHIDGDNDGIGDPSELCREITASDCTLGRLEP